MNARVFRLVFNAVRGAFVPVSEAAQGRTGSPSAGRQQRRPRNRVRVAAGTLAVVSTFWGYLSLAGLGYAAQPALPVPATNFVTSGSASQSVAGTTMTVKQGTDRAILNWQSFNINTGHLVQFNQPSAGSIALNRIGSADPSVIAGGLRANGQIYLYNQNGILFAQGAQINVGGLVATTLNISDDVFQNGILSITDGRPAFSWQGTPEQFGGSFVRLDAGANIRTADGGRVMLFAPRVENAGKIETPGGQAILAAGAKVYLQASSDVRLRGLLVEVDPLTAVQGGTVTNQKLGDAVGEIVAQRGNVTLMGLAVNQNGRVSATTSVSANGSVYLLARDSTIAQAVPGETRVERNATRAGVLTLGEDSITQVLPDLGSSETSIDAQTFNPSQVVLQGNKIHLKQGSSIVAPGGEVTVTALRNPSLPVLSVAGAPANDSRIFVDARAIIDVSGTSDVEIPVERNIVTAELRGNELRDAPLQRDGILQGRKVLVDARRGTPLADVSGYVAQTGRGVGERTAAGGEVSFRSEGDIVLREGAVVDVSGGSLQYLAGTTSTTKLVSNGKVYDIGEATPDLIYQSVFDSAPQREASYIQGADAGTVRFVARALALDGTLRGGAVTGPQQRDPSNAPLQGQLILGDENGSATRDFRLPDIILTTARGSLTPALLADPLNGPLGERARQVTLSLQPMLTGGFNRVALYSNERVQVPIDLALSPGGSFSARARRVEVSADLIVPGGTISLTSGATLAVAPQVSGPQGVTIAGGSFLSTAGLWINDPFDRAVGAVSSETWIDGGSITVSSAEGISIDSGAVVGVSGGARIREDRIVISGDAGSITLTTNVGASAFVAPLDLRGSLRGFAVGTGGTLSMTAPRIRLGGTAEPGELGLSAAFFQSGGFANYTLNGLIGMTVAAGTAIEPQVTSLLLRPDYAVRPTGSSIFDVATFTVLPEQTRSAASVTLSASDILAGVAVMEEGSSIRTDIGGSVALSAGAQLTVLGSIAAPAGKIALAISSRPNQNLDPGFLDNQSLWIGEHAALSARGAARVVTNAQGRRTGSVAPGGQISITAGRGYIVVEEGAVLDVSGTAPVLDLPAAGGVGVLYRPREVQSDAGRITVESGEGILFDGTVLARPGGTTAAGGSLQATVDRKLLVLPPVPNPYTTTERRIDVIEDGQAVPDGLRPGDVIDRSKYNGVGILSMSRLRDAQLDEVTLVAESRIRFLGDVTLSAGRSVTLDAPVLATAAGAHAVIASPYVELANRNPIRQGAKQGASGTGSLTVRAQLIDLEGAVGLQGFDSVSLEAATDIRLRGVLDGSATANQLIGSLTGTGTMTLSAQQIYPTTLTTYTLDFSQTGDSSVEFLRVPGSAPIPLTAGGALTVKADHIFQSGTVRAPSGSITLQANVLTLAEDSETSVSAAGMVIPFGKVENAKDWLYDFRNGVARLFARPPEKAIELRATHLAIADGARVDLSGGGDLYAHEFVPGLGGSVDYLGQPGIYAVLPGLSSSYAPFDYQYSAVSDLRPGDSVTLAGGAGLPAGTYTLLPGYYALLPGAFAVRRVNGYQDLLASQSVALPSGGAVVAGTRSVAGSGAQEQRTAGFLVESSALVRRRAEYDDFFASSFFQSAALRDGTAVPRLPADAGRLVLAASGTLALDGIVNLSAGISGRGGLLDVVANRIAVLGPDRAAPTGFLAISAEELSAFGAQSVLIGGTRAQDNGGVRITTSSTDVIVDNASVDSEGRPKPLTVGELMIVASDRISVSQASAVAAVADGELYRTGDKITVSGDGAFLRVSSDPELRLQRIDTRRLAGRVEVADDVSLSGKSVELDGTLSAQVGADVVIASPAVGLGASSVTFATSSTPASGLAVGTDLLKQLGGASTLLFRGYDGIDFLDPLQLGTISDEGVASLSRLVLDTPSIRWQGATPGSVTFTAATIELQNTGGVIPSQSASGAGNFELVAVEQQNAGGNILLGANSKAMSGFGNVLLHAPREIQAARDGALAVTGNLAVESQRMTAAAAASQSLAATGQVTVSTVATAASLPPVTALGGSISITGATLSFGGTIDLPSGTAQLRSTAGDLVLDEHSIVSVAGVARAFDGVGAYTDGGSVSLVSDAGTVKILPEALVDVSAPAAGGNAGQLSIRAGAQIQVERPTVAGASMASIAGAAGSAGRSGRFASSAGTGTSDAVMDLLGSLSVGGFDEISLAIAAGDLSLQGSAGSLIRVRHLSLSVDGGALTVLTPIEASAGKDPRISLWSRDDLTIGENVTLTARASTPGADGGTIELGSANGWVRLGRKSVFDVSAGSGGEGGTVLLRVPRTATNNGVQLAVADSSASGGPKVDAKAIGASKVVIEGVRTYSGVTAISSTAGSGRLATSTVNSDVATFMSSAATIRSAFAPFVTAVQPGVEIRSTGHLSLDTPWDLYSADRPGGQPGYLTLRAAGTLSINASLSDGFDAAQVLQSDASWSYRLVGGAALSGADPMRTQSPVNATSGDVILGAGVAVRTGTGTIQLAARRDFKLSSDTSVLYTAGRAAEPVSDFNPPESSAFPTDGGRISLAAGRDAIGVATTQLVTNWNFRQGTTLRDPVSGEDVFFTDTNTAWWIRYDRFRQNIGALGGGDVSISAGRDIKDLAVMLPTNGRMSGAAPARPNDANLLVLGGGDLSVVAGRDVAGGQFYVARGDATIRAGGSLTLGAAAVAGQPALYPILTAADTQFDVTAGSELNIETVLNPTVAAQPFDSYFGDPFFKSYYFTYSNTASVRLRALTGDVIVRGRTDEIALVALAGPGSDRLDFNATGNEASAMRVMPPSLKATAFEGSVRVLQPMTLFPASRGELEVFATDDVVVPGSLYMSDYTASALPRTAAPSVRILDAIGILNSAPLFSASHAPVLLHAGDPNPARVIALNGDIVGGVSTLGGVFPKSARVIAGRDIVDFYTVAQNLTSSDVTLVQAGRDVRYSAARSSGTNQLVSNLSQIAVGGPGQLEVIAGRDVDLGTSFGITTLGNLANPALPDQGASIRVRSGANTRLDADQFLSSFPGIQGAAGQDLASLVRELVGNPDLTTPAAFEAFRQLSPADQIRLASRVAGAEFYRRYLQAEDTPGVTHSYRSEWVSFAAGAGVDPDAAPLEAILAFRYQVLWPELLASGRAAVAGGATPGDYSRGYEAISVSQLGGAFVSDGNVSLIFSQVKTQRGGDIEILVPGGGANVGLATPPSGFSKGPESLGIISVKGGDVRSMVLRDFSVNQSRVFTLEGGDILIWSSEGNIDAGRGAKTAISAPPPIVRISPTGELVVEFPGAASGSGIGVLLTRAGLTPGDVDLIAPTGFVNAGDAGIRAAGNLTIAAVQVIGAENIQVGGSTAGVPVQSSGAAGSISGLGNVGSEATKSAERATQDLGANLASANQALVPSFITVDVIGLGEEEDEEEKRRRKRREASPQVQ